jgi:hypothetical protein
MLTRIITTAPDRPGVGTQGQRSRSRTVGFASEQQALAKWGLNYVIDEYLPRKLADPGSFLP